MKILSEWAEEKGHDLVCVTSQKPHASHHTLSWLGKYGLNFDTVYFRKGWKKWMVDVDYLVDDSPNNYDNWVRGRGMQEGFILNDCFNVLAGFLTTPTSNDVEFMYHFATWNAPSTC